jgi:hypothetical protein
MGVEKKSVWSQTKIIIIYNKIIEEREKIESRNSSTVPALTVRVVVYCTSILTQG